MNEGIGIAKQPNSLNSEHLIAGIKPIITCMGNDCNILERNSIEQKFNDQLGTMSNVNYSGRVSSHMKEDFLGEKFTWMISPLDDSNKFSKEFLDCTSLIVAGRVKTTGRNVSFMTHQDPVEFLNEQKQSKFIKDLNRRLTETSDICEAGTIDAVIVGGMFPTSNRHGALTFRERYLNSIKLLSEAVNSVFNFEPAVINGPKLGSGSDDIYYENEQRRLYLLRPTINPDIGNFTQSTMKEEGKEKN